jgi:hypothetical protein
MTKNKQIKTQILAELNTISTEQSFVDWLNSETIPTGQTCYLIFNNSFLFREDIKTVKSPKYLACKISTTKNIDFSQCYVIQGVSLNSPYKIIIDSPSLSKLTIIQEVKNELTNLGELVFVLIGEIIDDVQISESISSADIKEIVLNPTQTDLIEFAGCTLKIKDYSDGNLIWDITEQHLVNEGKNVPSNLSAQIESALLKIQRRAYSKLEIPNVIDSSKKYLIDKITQVIQEHIADYSNNIANISYNQQAYNEILRISYNFVSDINKLLILIINVCDLKPIVLWMNIHKFLKLDITFKELPFGFSNTKPSLKTYETLIKNARNKTFHQLFPFNKSLELRINNLDDIRLRMFSSFNNKSDNEMSYKDKKLAEILLEFTRVVEQSVDNTFWVKNQDVMNSINRLIIGISSSLKVLRS